MRLFIAFDLPESWKELLITPQNSIGWLARGIRWVEPANMHLTLKFLGEVEPNEVKEISRAIAESCSQFSPFQLRIKGTGVFPNRKQPRVFWAGLNTPQTLLDLQKSIEQSMDEIGFPPEEQEFKPHLTVARVKDSINKERISDAFVSFKLASEPHLFNEVLLIESHLSSERTAYKTLAKFTLITKQP